MHLDKTTIVTCELNLYGIMYKNHHALNQESGELPMELIVSLSDNIILYYYITEEKFFQ